MSKKRLEEIKEKVVVEKVYVKQLNTRNNGYWTKSYLVLKDDWNWLIEQAELSGHFVQKNGELNEFLNKYCEATHWGRNVIDVAIDIIKNQAERVQELENVNRVMQKANEGLERTKERLREQIENVKNRITPYLTHTEDEMDYLVSRVKELEQQNKHYREALESLVKQETLGKDIKTGKTAISYNGMIALKGLGIFDDGEYVVYGADEIIESVLESESNE